MEVANDTAPEYQTQLNTYTSNSVRQVDPRPTRQQNGEPRRTGNNQPLLLPLPEDTVSLSRQARQQAENLPSEQQAATESALLLLPEDPNERMLQKSTNRQDKPQPRADIDGNNPYQTSLTKPYIPRGQFISIFG